MSVDAANSNEAYVKNALWIVIPVFNAWTTTKKCLTALSRSEHKDFRVVVVDHGTDDETAKGMAREFPDYTRVAGGPEIWWAGATNLGIRHAIAAGARMIMLLNNDAFVETTTIETLIECSRRVPGTIVAPVQVSEKSGEVLFIGLRHLLVLGFVGLPGPRRITQKMQKKGLLPVPMIGGGRGVIVPVQVFDKVGLLDDAALPHYYSDNDFYIRCKAAGVPLYICLASRVRLDESRTSVAHDYELLTPREFLASLHDPRSHRNIKYLKAFFRKHYPVRSLYLVGYWLSIGRYLVMYFLRRARRRLTSV